MATKSNMQYPVALSQPYPLPTDIRPSKKEAGILHQSFASAQSEMTAITSYLYQSWILQKNYPEVASTIRRIAQVEMHHINILGDLIIRLSGNPKYISYQPRGTVFWNGRMVPQFDQIGKYLEWDVRGEKMAARQYQQQAKEICNGNVSAILTRLAEDELLHAEIFRSFLIQVKEEK